MQNEPLLWTRFDAAAFDPFQLPLVSSLSLHRRAALLAARPLLTRLLALGELRRLYERAHAGHGATFCARALKVLDVGVDLAANSEPAVPAAGPVIVVANHPHGMLDGLALVDVVERSRRDVRVLSNELLASLPALTNMCIFVHAFDGRATGQTRAGLRAALRWLQQGHALVLFPAGAVAHGGWRDLQTPSDADWRDTVARLAANSGASVVPAHIAGRNRDWFYRAGQIHGGLRTLLLARELLAKRGERVVVRLGRPLALARHAAQTRAAGGVTALLRAHVERLGDDPTTSRPPTHSCGTAREFDLSADVSRLDPKHRLIQSGRFDVYCAPASELPAVLPEIGRLREVSFRGVGEGTGRAIDLDRFDELYLHLFVWDREAKMVAGAYRLGVVDRIVAAHGIDGLYTSTLYRYDQRLLSRLGPAIELGRSFVRVEYQRSSNTLLLLWKGIAQFVLRSGPYRVLFGPVSISAHYSDMSHRLLQAFLLQNARHRELAELVTAMTPPPGSCHELQAASSVQALDRLITEQEPDGKGVPVLLRQYLRLNAKLLAFNVDPAFNDAIDALMMVDLAQVDRAMLTRYFGAEGADHFLQGSSRRAAA